jgi:heptosyltransferase-2
MNSTSDIHADSPILLVPYMWIGDFVRCHSVVRLLKERYPSRPIDVLTTTLCAPLLDYMPGVRKGVVVDLPRKQLALGQHNALADRLKSEGYGTALVMPRTWKAALAPFLAGIPQRIGFVGEARFGLINDLRWGEKKLPRMIDRCGALTFPKGAEIPKDWPKPDLQVPLDAAQEWRKAKGLDTGRPVIAFAPGAVGPSKRWPLVEFAKLGRERGIDHCDLWILGGPGEHDLAESIVRGIGSDRARNLTSADLRNAILALKLARATVSNDSGLVHVSAGMGTPTIGIFGPTSPWHWAPLNPLAATIEALTDVPCRPCHKPVCALGHHRCMNDIPAAQVMSALAPLLT